jgi:hypothetical protein
MELHARGERENTIIMPFRIADEIKVHELLEAHDVVVPHAYGLCPSPYALVMDRLPGHVDLSFAGGEVRRRELVDEYLGVLDQVYRIDLDAVAGAGMAVPVDDEGLALGYFRRIEAVYDQMMAGAPLDPMAVFLRRWLGHNVPSGRLAEARFILYDAFQFMFLDGRITGVIDFELAHVGDPLMDLAALRVRDTIKHIGDLEGLIDRYQEITGRAIDEGVIGYHCVVYNAISVLSVGPSLISPTPGVDWLSYLAWYVNGARWAFETIAELRGYRLDPVAVPEPDPSWRHGALQLLAGRLKDYDRTGPGDYETQTLGRIANHLKRLDEVGPALAAADLDDLSDLLGYRPPNSDAAELLCELIDRGIGTDLEGPVLRVLDRRAQRLQLTLASASSLMVRHPRLRPLTGGTEGDEPDEGWPAGSIPGTA